MILTPDLFFSRLFKHVPKDFEVLTFEKKGEKLNAGERLSPFSKDQQLSKIRRANGDEKDLYFHCGIDFAKERKLRLRKCDVDAVGFLWADIDRGLSQGELGEIQKDLFAPTVIVSSGNGYHLYWELTKLETDLDAAERKNRWLAERFNADKCVDVSRVLRVPGSNNCKKTLLPVKVVYISDSDLGYEFSVFDEVESRYKLSADFEGLVPEQLSDDFLEDKRFGRCTWLKDLIETDLDEESGDHSGRDWRVANKLAELGFTDGEILGVLTHPRWDTGFKGRDNPRYAKMTVSKAANAVRSLDGLVAMLEQQEVTVEAAPKKKLLATSELIQLIREVHEDILQEGGTYRKTKHCPKYGGLFGEKCAEVIFTKGGYRPVFDAEYGQGFIADRCGGVWEVLGGTESFNKFVAKVSGFSAGQQEFGFISTGIQTYIEAHGEQITVGRWVHYDEERKVFYILANADTGEITCITKDGINKEWNGVSDVFLRPRIQASQPINITEEFMGKDGLEFLERGFVNLIAGSQETKDFLRAFLIAMTMCYGSPIRTLPMIHLTGPSGGGKSTTLGCMTSFLFGYYQILIYTLAGAFRTAPSETFMAHDDKEDLDGISQFLLLCATSALRTMCDVRNPNDVVIQKAHVINGVTSIGQMHTVALRRRTFVLEIDAAKFPSAVNLTEEETSAIVDHRDAMWSGLVPIFRDMIGNFSDGTFRTLSRKVYNRIAISEFKGLADFVALMVLIDKSFRQIMGKETVDEDTTIDTFTTVSGLQDKDEILGRDPMVLCLESFFEKLFATNSREMYYVGDLGEGEVQTVTINRGVQNFQWQTATDEENAEIEKLLGFKVRGIKASSTGWVSIFSADTRAFAQSINSPTSLGKQFSRVAENKSFPFYITSGRDRKLGRIWNVFQKIE